VTQRRLQRATRTVAALLLSLATGLAATSSSAAAAVPAGNRIPWQGKSWYFHGANVPWFNWPCDFGCNAKGGVSAPDVSAALKAKFLQAQTSGLHAIRWWVFEGDAWQITRDAAGGATGVNPAVYADFDAALKLAETYDLYYDFVLFSAPTAIPRSWLTDTPHREQVAAALGPLFAHYKDNPRVMTWEVFNEPEWDIMNAKIDAAAVQATVRLIADSVHANSNAYVTVGGALMSQLPLMVGQHLDYYQVHWYDVMKGADCARCTDYETVRSRYNLDRPLVIGELYAPSTTDAGQRFADLYAKGYAGAWPWSLFADHTGDKFSVDLSAAEAFSKQHGDLGPVGVGGQAPPPPPSPAPGPGGAAFVLGFADFRARLGDTMGDPVESEHGNSANCDTQQLTTTGLAFWRCSTNTMTFAAFPDGLHHWALVGDQIVEWIGPSSDPPA
jgi:hypothetical protein